MGDPVPDKPVVPEILYRFGLFALDPATITLTRKGSRVRLQEQPFQLLVLLLERAGKIVSREEIQQRLWPGNTFVEFDKSLSVAVLKVREALGDDAGNPRFVETVPRRGYRFIAPVMIEGSDAPAVATTDIATTSPANPGAESAVSRLPHGRSTRDWLIPSLLFLLVAVSLAEGTAN